MFWLFRMMKLPQEGVAIVIPFAKWQEAANNEVFTNLPRKS